MKAIDFIKTEQLKQREKHGYTEQHDDEHYNGELKKAALYALTMKEEYKQNGFDEFESKMEQKNKVQKLIIAAALLASEIDRINNQKD